MGGLICNIGIYYEISVSSVNMRINPLFTTSIIVTLFISLVCCLIHPKKFINCFIPDWRTIWISRDLPNYLFSFWYPGSLLPIF